jgi:hypothetical protein
MGNLDLELTIATSVKLHHISDPDIDYTKKSLISFLKLLLVEDLHRQDTILCNFPVVVDQYQYPGSNILYGRGGGVCVEETYRSKLSFQ